MYYGPEFRGRMDEWDYEMSVIGVFVVKFFDWDSGSAR